MLRESELRTQLMNTANSWLKGGYGLAGTLLINFLMRKGATPGDIIDFSQFSSKIDVDAGFRSQAEQYFTDIAVQNANPFKIVTLKLADKLVLNRNPAFYPRWYGGELFWAFFGARAGYKNAVLVIDPVKKHGKVTWTCKGTMQLEDSYSFPSRLFRSWFSDYRAAKELEGPPYNYARFTVFLEWNANFSGSGFQEHVSP